MAGAEVPWTARYRFLEPDNRMPRTSRGPVSAVPRKNNQAIAFSGARFSGAFREDCLRRLTVASSNRCRVPQRPEKRA